MELFFNTAFESLVWDTGIPFRYHVTLMFGYPCTMQWSVVELSVYAKCLSDAVLNSGIAIEKRKEIPEIIEHPGTLILNFLNYSIDKSILQL